MSKGGRDGGRQACALHEPEGLLAAARFPRFYPAPTAIPRAQPAAQYVCVALGGIRPAIRHLAALATKFVTRPLLCRPPEYDNPLLYLFQVSRGEA